VNRPLPRILPPLVLACAALTLAACGASPSSPSGKSDEEQQLAFHDCLRDEGLEVRSMDGGRGIAVRSTAGPGEGKGQMSSSTDRAFETCRRRTGWAPRPPSEAEQAEARDRALRFARCMRAHGVDMADPASDGRMMLRVEGDSPTARSAMRACGDDGFGMGAGAGKPAR
jgi:hypothetical protein